MCLSCKEHVAARLWYLEAQAHESGGWLSDWVGSVIYTGVIVPGLKSIKDRQPYGSERWGVVNRAIYDWIGLRLRGFQVLPDAESAFKVIDQANEIGLTVCSCHKTFDDTAGKFMYRCLGLNHSARITYQRTQTGNSAQDIRLIGKDEAKGVITEWRAKGCLQSVGWDTARKVTWMCNCDLWCGCHRTPELQWGMIPSFFVSYAAFPARCEQCGTCQKWCQRQVLDAITLTDRGPVIDEGACWGCGQCTERCPRGVLALRPRRAYLDPIARKRVTLPPEVVQV